MAALKDKARDLEADLAICEAATPGPWEIDDGGSDAIGLFDSYGEAVLYASACPITGAGLRGRVQDEANIRFAAAAREGWPYAIRRAMAAEAEIDRLRNELNILQQQVYGSEVYGIDTSTL